MWSFGVTMCEMFNNGEEPNLANMEKGTESIQQHVLLQALETGARYLVDIFDPLYKFPKTNHL